MPGNLAIFRLIKKKKEFETKVYFILVKEGILKINKYIS